MKKIVIGAITIYQKTISPDHGLFRSNFPYGYCRHYPSCSEYTKQSVETNGVLKGLIDGFFRILRCNPYASPSIDKPKHI